MPLRRTGLYGPPHQGGIIVAARGLHGLTGERTVKTRMKRSGMMLVIAGLLVLVFFLATDAAIMPAWADNVGWSRNQVDAVTDARWGTIIGVSGSVVIVITGLWLLIRRSV